MAERTEVMVVEDSPYMTQVLTDLIGSKPELKLIDTARDGAEAIRKLRRRRPDVVLLDLEMPKMDGLTFLERTMEEQPVPVVVVSGFGRTGARIFLDALEAGAVDFVPIPEDGTDRLRSFGSSLISRIQVAARVNPSILRRRRISRNISSRQKRHERADSASRIVVIGGSTGAPVVLKSILSELPGDLPAGLAVAQHMPGAFTASFAQRLDGVSKLTIREARDGDSVREGVALLVPGDCHMLIMQSRRVELSRSPRRLGVRPSTNMLMVSASDVFGANTIGVLLSGMGQDGAFGMKVIKKRGGTTMAQDEESSIVFGMARAALDQQAVDKLVPAEKLSQEIVRAVDEKVGERQG